MRAENLGAYYWPGIAVLWFSIGAFVINILFMEDNELLIQSTVSTALCAGPIWHFIVEAAEKSFIKRGLVAGFTVGIVVHPTFLVIDPLFWGEFTLGGPIGAILFTPWGLALFGYLTIPGGVVAGGLLGVIRYYTGQNPDIRVFGRNSG